MTTMTTDHDENTGQPSSTRISKRHTIETTPSQKRDQESATEGNGEVTFRDLIIISIGKLNSGFL